jgi:hypothetical protein
MKKCIALVMLVAFLALASASMQWSTIRETQKRAARPTSTPTTQSAYDARDAESAYRKRVGYD